VLRAHGVEVVISVMGGANILDQLGLIKAIQAAGTVKVLPRARAHSHKALLFYGAHYTLWASGIGT
jgi:hypothetical protein